MLGFLTIVITIYYRPFDLLREAARVEVYAREKNECDFPDRPGCLVEALVSAAEDVQKIRAGRSFRRRIQTRIVATFGLCV